LRPVRVHRIPAHVRDDRDTPLDAGLEQNVNIKEEAARVKSLRAQQEGMWLTLVRL
jgi:hypothetical protein